MLQRPAHRLGASVDWFRVTDVTVIVDTAYEAHLQASRSAGSGQRSNAIFRPKVGSTP